MADFDSTSFKCTECGLVSQDIGQFLNHQCALSTFGFVVHHVKENELLTMNVSLLILLTYCVLKKKDISITRKPGKIFELQVRIELTTLRVLLRTLYH